MNGYEWFALLVTKSIENSGNNSKHSNNFEPLLNF